MSREVQVRFCEQLRGRFPRLTRLVIAVKGSKVEAQVIRDQCRDFLEGKLKLTLNMEKTHITHVNDGFVFLGHRIIRKRGPKGNMRVVSGIPLDKAKAFSHSLSQALSTDYSCSKVDKVEHISRKLKGWAQFYRHTDFTAKVYSKIDRIVFWKLAKWLARKYRCSIKSLMMKWIKRQHLVKQLHGLSMVRAIVELYAEHHCFD